MTISQPYYEPSSESEDSDFDMEDSGEVESDLDTGSENKESYDTSDPFEFNGDLSESTKGDSSCSTVPPGTSFFTLIVSIIGIIRLRSHR
jgi:hypothetical protein